MSVHCIALFVVAVLFVQCSHSQEETCLPVIETPIEVEEKAFDFGAYGIPLHPKGLPYVVRKQKFLEQRNALAKQLNAGDITIQEVGDHFTNMMVKELFPYWYRTKWEFSGHTNTPQEGEIACGYYVSTTLKHAGVNVNRYRMAQQSALSAAKTVAGSDTLYRLYRFG